MALGDEVQYAPPLLHCEPKPLLYLAGGTPLKRQMGFAMQTTGTFPQLSDNTRRKPGKGGKKR